MALPVDATPARRYLSGDTYGAKDRLTALGALYDPSRRQWYITPEKDSAAFSQWL
jgi:DNA helicase-2/ATP-dependent DNA helicase PcrA